MPPPMVTSLEYDPASFSVEPKLSHYVFLSHRNHPNCDLQPLHPLFFWVDHPQNAALRQLISALVPPPHTYLDGPLEGPRCRQLPHCQTLACNGLEVDPAAMDQKKRQRRTTIATVSGPAVPPLVTFPNNHCEVCSCGCHPFQGLWSSCGHAIHPKGLD